MNLKEKKCPHDSDGEGSYGHLACLNRNNPKIWARILRAGFKWPRLANIFFLLVQTATLKVVKSIGKFRFKSAIVTTRQSVNESEEEHSHPISGSHFQVYYDAEGTEIPPRTLRIRLFLLLSISEFVEIFMCRMLALSIWTPRIHHILCIRLSMTFNNQIQ